MEKLKLPAEERLFHSLKLPHPGLEEEWQRLILPPDLQPRLLRYLQRLQWLGQRGASSFGLALRRSVLLYGPPGCGKTSLARGLPQAWAQQEERSGVLVQVHSHALPSGERGGTQKNVLSLFRQLAEVASPGQPTFVLLDEVESVGTDRAQVNPETNPLDTLYAVNALLESLDAFTQEHPNVVFSFTTNLPRAVDRAFRERVDFAVYVPPPEEVARRAILEDALGEVGSGANGQTAGWKPLLKATAGFSARELRHLVVAGLTWAEKPEEVALGHLLEAARAHLAEQEHHRKTGGIYNHDYQRSTP